MGTEANTPDATARPAALWPASTDRRGRFTRILGIVRKLIDYGKELAISIRERGLTERPAGPSAVFGTLDISLILSRIGLALLRCQALEVRLQHGAIAAEIRRRPVGAVLADICRDLGIAARAIAARTARAPDLAILFNGGGVGVFFNDMRRRAHAAFRASTGGLAVSPAPSLPLSLEPAATGPP